MSGSISPSQQPATESRPHREAARPASFAAVPGWVCSGMLHAGVIVFLVTSGLPSCGDGQLGTGADHGEFREVGIYIKQPMDSQQQTEDPKDEQPQEPESTEATPTASQPSQATEVAAAELIDLPEVAPRSVIGQSRSAPSPGGIPNVSDALVTPNAVRAPQSPSQGEGPGRVSFMGQTTEAQTVVFVIDTSSSMQVNNAIEYAQAKLKQSINGLKPTQQFQIVSYTLVPTVMRLRNERAEHPPLYPATGPNLTLATQFINGLRASGGTKHRPALMEAFRFKPDVIFFLTDDDADRISPRELSEIKSSWNKQGKTSLHSIQFGSGPNLQATGTNALKKLASENRGTYTYVDIDKLENP